jgi:hypothetical protein
MPNGIYAIRRNNAQLRKGPTMGGAFSAQRYGAQHSLLDRPWNSCTTLPANTRHQAWPVSSPQERIKSVSGERKSGHQLPAASQVASSHTEVARILVVDDDRDTCENLADILRTLATRRTL